MTVQGSRRQCVMVCATALMLGVAASPAAASTSVHVFASTFGSGGSTPANPYPLSAPSSVSVDEGMGPQAGGPSAGAVYVADTGNHWVEKFDSAGNLVWIVGGAVDQTTGGNVCTVASGDACQAGTTGSAPGQFTTPRFVSVDNSGGAMDGDVYVADTGDNIVQRFHPNGTLDTSWGDGGGATCGSANGQLSGACATGGPFTGIAGIAVDSSGSLNVLDPNTGNRFEFAPDGTAQPVVTMPGGQAGNGIGVDSAGDLFAVTGGGNVEEYGASGTDLGNVTADTPDAITGLTVDPATGDVYADDAGTTIRHYNGSTLSTCVPAGSCVATQTFGSGNLTSASGLGVNAVSGTVYAADPGAADVSVFTVYPPAAPTVDREWATGVDSSSATLHAEINPQALDTSCKLQYGTTTAYSTGTATCSPSDLGAGTTDAAVTASLTGLAPGTSYHYRFVAVNADGTTDGPDHTITTFSQPASQSCPNAQFRTGPSAALPDCRAWEQVSPVEKNGLDAIGENSSNHSNGFLIEAAPGGNNLMYQSASAYANPVGNPLDDAYLSTRGAAGWQTANVSPPTPDPGPPGGFAVDYEFSPDLSRAVYEVPSEPLAPGAAPNVENLFLRRFDGSFSLITNAPRSQDCPPDNPFGQLCFEVNSLTTLGGASSDYSHVIFEANDNLTPDAPGGQVNNLYESVDGQVSFVGILPDGAAALQGSQPGSGEIAAQQSFGAGGGAVDVAHAISADGSRIFFSAAADGGQPDAAQSGMTEIYERVNGSSTVEVSAPGAGATPMNSTPEPATYWGASSDGSLVFFTSRAELTSDANTGTGNAGNDLYEFHTASGALTDLTVDANPADAGAGANVQGVVGTSTDGQYVYFVANGQLIPGKGTDGQPNLYLYHAGQVSFIATLAPGVSPGDANDWTNRRDAIESYVTPDGQHLAFMSTLPLTGYDNTDQNTGQRDSEVFEYSAPGGQLVCGSCDPSGAEPVGRALIETSSPPFGSSPFYEVRALSDDGSRLFFVSPDALTPGAGSAHDKVYEYEHGTVYLVAAAATANASFLDASASGNDVFVSTRDPLVPDDQDELVDVYDARVDGGFPAPPASVPCQGDACQGSPIAVPSLPMAATVSFNGPGNATPPTTRPAGKVKLLRHTVSGDAFVLTVQVPAAGTIAISGRWVKGARRSISHAGTYRLTVKLTPAGRRALTRRKRLGVTVKVRYQPRAGSASSATVRTTFTAPTRVRRRASRHTAHVRQPAARRPR